MSRTIFALVDDIFFASKIRATAEALGVTVQFLRSKDLLVKKLGDTTSALIIVDLHNQSVDAVELATEVTTLAGDVFLLGFFSHVEVDLQRQAIAAGFNRVIPRSVFAKDLGEILKEPESATDITDTRRSE